MLKIYIITPFPDFLVPVLQQSMFKKSVERNKVEYNIINLFDFLDDKDSRIDDYPYGGGEGMIMKAKPIFRAFDSVGLSNPRVIFPTPDGELFNQKMAFDLSKEKEIIFICGHYKGIDQRIRNNLVTDEVSIGDYVLTNGEIPSLVMIDSIMRLIPGVLNDYKSAEKDSFSEDLLDGPHYTRPKEYKGLKVPDILLSGNHVKIKEWFLKKRIDKTSSKRKDLFEKYKSKNSGDKNE
jgi:tRNA (guanine37-N1)-methyltransferase|tara:strand:- start:478 stop:1185 length:708 start_codon:yes stop_codon:yes gene_type:complete